MKLQIVNMILNFIILGMITYSCFLIRANRKISEELRDLNKKNREFMEIIFVHLQELRAKLREIECQDE